MASSPAAAAAGGGGCSGLSPLFKARAVAVVGATERPNAVGRTVLENLLASRKAFCEAGGAVGAGSPKAADKENGAVAVPYEIYAVNPTRPEVLGVKCFPAVDKCPPGVDVAIVVTPAKTVPEVVRACGRAGVQAAVIISAGFKEVGPEGLALENEAVAIGRAAGVRVVGPNCLGIMAPYHGMNATFAACNCKAGAVAFISQSGAMCTAVLDWSLRVQLGFSAFVSIGSMADVQWSDLISYLDADAHTKAILVYMEMIGDAGAFMRAAQKSQKPIVVIKAGQTEEAATAAASHTGSLAGSHGAFLAAMQRAGVMVVDTIGELCDVALFLDAQPRPAGGNLMIVTNAGGPGVLATDATSMSGAKVAKLSDAAKNTLNGFLPAAWSHANPVDVLGDAGPELYAKTMEAVLADGGADGCLVVLSPQSVTDPTGTAKEVINAYKKLKAEGKATKPIICSWMGGAAVEEGTGMLQRAGVPCYSYPDQAAKVFGKVWGYEQLRRKVAESAKPAGPRAAGAQAAAPSALKMIAKARSENRDLLTEAESKELLALYGIPIAETVICTTADAAAAAAERVKFPCVVKLHSEIITHKSDVGGVKLNLTSAAAVKQAFADIEKAVKPMGPNHFLGVTVQPMIDIASGIELIVDAQFGPLILFGTGGVMVEIFKDSALGLPPLNSVMAQVQMESTKIYAALKGCGNERFPGVDVPELNRVLCRFSELVADLNAEVAECDINPLLALKDRLVALDARIVLRKKEDKDTPVTPLCLA